MIVTCTYYLHAHHADADGSCVLGILMQEIYKKLRIQID